MNDFVSQLETLLPCRELLFNGTPGFGRYASLLSHSVAHPAKMNTRLTEFLILELTKPGEVVLDPMSGTGQTGLVAALNGRDAVCVELEEKFHNWQLEAKGKLDMAQTFTIKGSLNCILGDSRKLGDLLTAADAIVTSPPYADQNSRDRKPDATRNVRGRGNIGAPYDAIDAVVTSPTYSGSITGNLPNTEERAQRMIAAGYDPKTILGGKARNAQVDWHYAPRSEKDNIGNLSHGDIDAIITSPPYSEGIGHKAGDNASHEHEARLAMQEKYTNQMVSPGNIAVLKHGEVDAIITSPPYEDAVRDDQEGPLAGGNKEKYGRWKDGSAKINSYTSHDEPCKIDAVITSPPYETSKPIGDFELIKKVNLKRGRKIDDISGWSTKDEGYGESKENIGNMKKETYLQAMLTVYSEMFKVLKQNGTAAIIVKPFIRNKQVVDLPFQTWLLMQKCGFELTKLYKLRLDQQSFWRVLYMKKHPEVAEIWHEYVLVCTKPKAPNGANPNWYS